MHTIKIFFISVLLLFLPLISLAFVTNSWVGPAAGSWNTAANWSNGIPGATDSVVIGAGHTVTFNAPANVTIGSLNIFATSVLNVTSFKTVTMNSLRLNGSITGASTQNFMVGNIAPAAISGSGTFALSGGGSLRLNSNISIQNAADDIKITSGALVDLNGFTLSNNGKLELLDPSDFKNVAGTFKNASATAYLFYTRRANFPALVVLNTVFPGNTTEFAATAAGPYTMDKQGSYSNLIITGNGFTKTLNAAVLTVIIANNLTINAGAIFNCNGRPINIAGNWINNSGTFIPGVGTVTFNGVADQSINGTAATQTFNNLVVNLASGQTLSTGGSTTTLTTNNFTETTGNFSAPATLNINSAAASSIVLTAGTFTAGTSINITGNWTNNGGTFVSGTNTVNFKGTGNEIINGTAVAQSFNNLVVNMTAGRTLSVGGSTVALTTNNITETTGNFTAPATLNINASASASLTLTAGTFTAGANINIVGNWTNNGGVFTPGVNTVNFIGTAGQLINGTAVAQTFYNVFVNLTAGQLLTTGGSTVTLTTNNLTVMTGNFTSPATLNINKTATATITLTAGTFTAGATINITGNWTNNGGTFIPGTNTVNFKGTSNEFINGTAGTQTFYNVVVNLSAGFLLSTGGSAVTLNTNNLTGTSGNFTAPATLNINASVLLNAGTFTAGTNINIAGNWTNNGGVYVPGANTVNFIGTSAQLINGIAAAQTFNNVVVNLTAGQLLTTGGSTVTLTTNNLSLISGNFTAPATLNLSNTATASLTISAGTFIAGTTINLKGNWTHTAGIYTPGVSTVNFTGTTTQNITDASGEIFYKLTSNCTGPIVLAATTSVMVTNTLTMTAGRINVPSGQALTLGNNAVATLVYTAGNVYGPGTFSRYLPAATAISSTVAPRYGLFPVGTSLAYRPIELNTTVNLTSAGYCSVIHTDPGTYSELGTPGVNDGTGIKIQRYYDATSTISTSGIAGGTYNLNMTMTGLSLIGATANIYLEANIGGTPTAKGITAATGGTVSAPVGKRTGLSLANLSFSFIICTNNEAGTPMEGVCYSRATGNWNTIGTWSNTSGGPSCGCVPAAKDSVIILTGHTIILNTSPTINSLYIKDGATLTINSAGMVLTIGSNGTDGGLTIDGSGQFTSTAAATLPQQMNGFYIAGSTVGGNSGTYSVTQDLNFNFNAYVPSSATFNFSGPGNLNMGSHQFANYGTLTFGALSNLKNGTFLNASSGVLNDNANASFPTGTTLNASAAGNIVSFGATAAGTYALPSLSTFYTVIFGKSGGGASVTYSLKDPANPLAVNSDLTINSNTILDASLNNVDLTVAGNWLNNSGTFTPGTGTVTFKGAIAQSITKAGGETFNNLSFSGAGTKLMGSPLTATGNLTIGAGSLFDVSTNSFALTVSGNWLDSGAFNARTGTVLFNKAGAQSITDPNGETFYNLSLPGGGTKTLGGAVTLLNDLTVASTTVLDAGVGNNAISIAGNWTNNGSFIPRAGTVTFNGSSTQTIANPTGETFNNLLLSGSGTTTLGNPITIGADLTISTGSALDVTGANYPLNVNGNLTNNGSFNTQKGTITLGGAAAQNIGGTSLTNFYNLTLNNTSGAFLNAPENLVGTLTLTNGTFTSTGQTFTLISTAANTARFAPITGGDFAGNIVMQRYITPGQTGWYFLGAPISSGLTLQDWTNSFVTSGFPGSTYPGFGFVSIYSYDESVPGILDSGYVAATNVTNSVNEGQGYWCYVGPTPLTVSTHGPPGKMNFTFPVTYTSSSGGPLNDGWNLVSNPYPSSIDWNAGGWTKTNISGQIHVWNPNTSTYASYVAGVSVNGGNHNLASGQAFWVQTTGMSPVLKITESCKTATDTICYRMLPSNQSILRLRISGNGYYDETAISFNDSATIHYDKNYDAMKLFSSNVAVPSLSTIADGKDMSINSLPWLNASTVIPVRALIGSGTSGTYTITVDSVMNLPMGSCLVLEDLTTGIMTDLRSALSYSFYIADTTSAPRFLIHIGDPLGKTTRSAFCPTSSDGMAIAQGIGTGPFTYAWYNTNDALLKTDNNISGSDTLHNLQQGIYKVMVSGNSGLCNTLNDTFSVQSPLSFSLFEAINNVSCRYNNDGGIVINATFGGTPPYLYSWSNSASGTSLNGITQGVYTVNLTDSRGCNYAQNWTVGSNSLLHAQFTVNSNIAYLDSGAEIVLTNTSAAGISQAWNFGDGSPVDFSLNPIHAYAIAGTYTVTLIISDGICSDTSRQTVQIMPSTTGINTLLINQAVTIEQMNGTYFASFNLPSEMQAQISMYDMLGNKVMPDINANVSHDKILIPLEGEAQGIYLLSVYVGNQKINRKIVIQ